MSKKSDKYLKVNGHVVRLPKKAYTATLDSTAKQQRERGQELADGVYTIASLNWFNC